MPEKEIKMIYKCIKCKDEIVRPIKENELILSGKTRCMKCGEWIIYFKIKVI